MKVLGLTEYFPKAIKIQRELKAPADTDLWLLVTGNTVSKGFKFYCYNLWYFLHLSWVDKGLALRLLLTGRMVLCHQSLHHEKVLRWINNKEFDIGLHNLSVIYLYESISLFRLGIINPHIGLLPQFRGRSVMEWSILAGRPTGITAFFIDTGIDTGKQLILFQEISVKEYDTIDKAKEYLFSQDIDIFGEALHKIANGCYLGDNDISSGKRYYVMSSLLKGVVEKIMKNNP